MREGRCYGCDRKSSNLLTANCGHKTCFHCVKVNRTSKRCSQCSLNLHNHSPSRHRNPSESKDRQSGKIRSEQLTASNQKAHKNLSHSPIMQTTRKNMITTLQENQNQNGIQYSQQSEVCCRQHGQPFSMYCQISKEIICAVCLYKKGKVSSGILPLKNAQDLLRRENRLQREESRIAMNQIENSYKICKGNKAAFESYLNSHLENLEICFKAAHQHLEQCLLRNKSVLTELFESKITECGQICSDFEYLNGTLAEYRQNNRENNSLNECIFVYESYRIIKKTLKTLDLDYISYAEKQPIISELNFDSLQENLNSFITLKTDFPLRASEVCWNREIPMKDYSKFNRIDEDFRNSRARSRKDRRIIGSIANNEEEGQMGLYQKILRSRFKA